ncbi:winged helix DNA-binding protein [Amylibacter sp. SFDW26]|uniref:MarR family winged helix-turn-helix transcriptional regulator n=1 Tax=Amylibacter sp. SFDW26 TaxID=2652722 RepID=UPI0012625717|nr:MarR family transcriptional regulator [Amylibacter sp. SFDW26]KAB7615397.1 winged helix DNA-binding protein [Amylibacter sp. SFDW26]
MNNDVILGKYFSLFNEIGIIEQLSRAFLEVQLPKGIIAPHFAVLNHLMRVNDGQTPLFLATAFQVPKTTMTHTLSGLSKHGLIEMRPNPKDARSKQVWLTEAGQELRNKTIAALGPYLQQVAEQVSTDELDTIVPILQKLREYMDEARNP